MGLSTQSEYALLSGVAGHFQTPKKMQVKSGIRLSGLNKLAMAAKMEELADQATYDIMNNNCAQQVARIAQAGLGCSIRDIPFLLPGSIQAVGVEIGRSLSSEEIKVIQSAMDQFPEDSFLKRVSRRLLGFFSGRRNLKGADYTMFSCVTRLHSQGTLTPKLFLFLIFFFGVQCEVAQSCGGVLQYVLLQSKKKIAFIVS